MTNPPNWRPGLPVTNLRFGIPVGNGGKSPWWCWVLYPALALICFPTLVLLFGWRKK